MNHCGTHAIETDRLLLRPLTVDDAQTMFENWAGDEDVTRFLRWDAHRNWTVTYEYLYHLEQDYENPRCYEWGIVQKSTGILMGSIGIQPSPPDPEWATIGYTDKEFWSVGYVLGAKWWNQGYATEALRAVCEYWFDNTGSELLVAYHHCENAASGRVLSKVGFILDHAAIIARYDGTPVDCDGYFLDRMDFLRPRGVRAIYEDE